MGVYRIRHSCKLLLKGHSARSSSHIGGARSPPFHCTSSSPGAGCSRLLLWHPQELLILWARRGMGYRSGGEAKRIQGLHKIHEFSRFSSTVGTSSESLAAKTGEDCVKPDLESPAEDKEKVPPESSSGPPPRFRTIRGSPVSWMSLALLIATGTGLLYFFDKEKKRRIEALKQGPVEVQTGPGVGKAAIGGPFKLTNHEGKVVTEDDFKGNWSLIYFGFTHCPDICPDELQKMVEALDKIEKKAGLKITPIFISVDPERDNVEQIREYVKEFHPRLIGLTGGANDIRQVAREYRVYYMKTEEEGSDYLVDHSIIMYLMDPQMEFVKFFGKSYDVNGLADGILEEIKSFRK